MQPHRLFFRITAKSINDSSIGIMLLLIVSLLIISTCSTDEKNESFYGIPGGMEGPLATSAPPINSGSWHKATGDVFGVDDVWGIRIDPITTFEIPDGMGLFYNSAPPLEWRNDSEWKKNQEKQGLVIGETGSVAFTTDLFNWFDYPENPILNEQQRSWQTHRRVLMGDIVFDPENNRWISYFGNMVLSRDEAGIRNVGVAYSKDLINWEYADGPILTIEDYATVVPDRIEATEEELHEHGRVYPGWAMIHNGRYYLTLSGTEKVGYVETTEQTGISDISRGRIALVSDSPEGPFELVGNIDEVHMLPGSKPVYWNGKWYSVFTGVWDEQPGFGLAWSDELFGTYTRNPENPIIKVETIQRTSPMLFHYDGIWGVFYTKGGNWWDDLPLRLAIANFHPSLLMQE